MNVVGLVLVVLGVVIFGLGYLRDGRKITVGPNVRNSSLLLSGAGLALVGGLIVFV